MSSRMSEITREEAHDVWRQAETLKRVSDRLISIGPFGIGADGITAFAPVVGTLYSAAAGAFVLWLGLKARASPMTLARMLAYIAADTVSSDVPILGQAFDFFFPGHLMAAKALQKDIVRRHGPPVDTMRHAGRARADGSSAGQPA
jgi:hypothetical protein